MRFSPRLACIAMPFIRPMALSTFVTLASCRVPIQVPGEKLFKDYRLAFMMD
jgi:hypothetical protein